MVAWVDTRSTWPTRFTVWLASRSQNCGCSSSWLYLQPQFLASGFGVLRCVRVVHRDVDMDPSSGSERKRDGALHDFSEPLARQEVAASPEFSLCRWKCSTKEAPCRASTDFIPTVADAGTNRKGIHGVWVGIGLKLEPILSALFCNCNSRVLGPPSLH